MKILLINSVCGVGSTGRICADLAQKFESEGHEVKIAYGRDSNVPEPFRKYALRIGSNLEVKLHALCTRLFDNHGFCSYWATKRFLKRADDFNPDLIWLHNLHGYYIHVGLLFDWLKKRPHTIKRWTLHDCWAFTGHCSFFTAEKCDKWQTQCSNCPQKSAYPSSYKDNSKANFELKKETFRNVENMTLITPSKWLADLVKKSFLRDYPLEVHYNYVDKNIFKPTRGDFRKKYGLENKKIILGAASVWDKRKGLKDFIKLSQMLDNKYKIVLVGLNKAQIKSLPPEILGLARTKDARELAEIYTASDIFFNPGVEETFGMTTVEALYCGAKAVVYEGTACAEIARLYGGKVINSLEDFPDAAA